MDERTHHKCRNRFLKVVKQAKKTCVPHNSLRVQTHATHLYCFLSQLS